MKVLVVEDNPSNMKLVVRLLKIEGCLVLEAEDADAGIRLARDASPDLILMDMNLPGMDGLTAIRLLKSDKDTCDIKIVALTAFAMDGDRERFLKAGCDEYMSKPIDYKAFLKMVGNFKPRSSDG